MYLFSTIVIPLHPPISRCRDGQKHMPVHIIANLCFIVVVAKAIACVIDIMNAKAVAIVNAVDISIVTSIATDIDTDVANDTSTDHQ